MEQKLVYDFLQDIVQDECCVAQMFTPLKTSKEWEAFMKRPLMFALELHKIQKWDENGSLYWSTKIRVFADTAEIDFDEDLPNTACQKSIAHWINTRTFTSVTSSTVSIHKDLLYTCFLLNNSVNAHLRTYDSFYKKIICDRYLKSMMTTIIK
jgi:hypothetical protein